MVTSVQVSQINMNIENLNNIITNLNPSSYQGHMKHILGHKYTLKLYKDRSHTSVFPGHNDVKLHGNNRDIKYLENPQIF